MAADHVLGERTQRAFASVVEVIQEHGTPESKERLSRLAYGRLGSLEREAYTAELLAGLAEIVAEIKECPKSPAQKKEEAPAPKKSRTRKAS